MNVFLLAEKRPLGLFIFGAPGSGKSSLLTNLILQDVLAGRGVCVIDPTGDLLKPIIQRLPEERIKDTVYFTTSTPTPWPIDFFSFADDDEKQMLSDDIVSIFNLPENAARARPLLIQAIATLFEANTTLQEKGKKFRFGLLDIVTLFKNRKKILDYCCEARAKDWVPFPTPNEYETITNRLIPFRESKTLRTVFTPAAGELKIPDIIQQGKVFLVDLKDTPTDLFLGSLIVSKIRQAVWRMGYQTLSEAERVPYYVYIDECGTIMKFAEEDFEKMILRARKYKLCLTLAIQLADLLPKGIQKSLRLFETQIYFHGRYYALCHTKNQGHQELDTPHFLPTNEAQYRQMLHKLTPQPTPCNSSQVSQDEGNDDPSDTDFAVPEDWPKKKGSEPPG